ncbi:hypothetical protein LUZ63_019221 [Rhynchospora breviuscula]|uniref:F-box domain-containing protein n=1 Tax=Rhynchospora breviuscula TaxID=2022672 RepID=A0A9Q0C5S6_9POAL|nr:hypothetical protein LUZ63_019221 [Rhynchospora breviuscula]
MSSTTERKRRRRYESPPPPSPVAAESAEEPDLISQLPDSILHSILSLLPIKDSALTSILSSRWRHLWEEAPLRLDDDSLWPHDLISMFNPFGGWSREAISRIFDSHHGPIEALRLSRFDEAEFHPAMNHFVESAIQRGIRELTLSSSKNQPYQLPPSLLLCKSLHQLSLINCRFPEALPPSIFPNLKELRLHYVPLHNGSLHILLSKCGSLETLHLTHTGELQLPSVSAVRNSLPRLRELVWHCCVLFKQAAIR